GQGELGLIGGCEHSVFLVLGNVRPLPERGIGYTKMGVPRGENRPMGTQTLLKERARKIDDQ
ncbi:hypothetical protein, partial [Pseudomonas sp. SDO55104_S430]